MDSFRILNSPDYFLRKAAAIGHFFFFLSTTGHMLKRLRLVALIMSRVISVLGCVRLFFLTKSIWADTLGTSDTSKKIKKGTGAKKDFEDIDLRLKLRV